MQDNPILPYVEPIFRFCRKRLHRVQDAEDLAQEILCAILEGMEAYDIRSLDAWVWRVAQNRYARFLDARRKDAETIEQVTHNYIKADSLQTEDGDDARLEAIYRVLHTLADAYRGIFVDYYLGGMSIHTLAERYALPETTVKWRLHCGREKVRTNLEKLEGDHNMKQRYNRINWDTQTCNGSMDSDRYLHTQLARAICQAAYEKPLTVEEISLSTGIPALYIEDELQRLIDGDAIRQTGNKYETDFIIFSLENRRKTEAVSAESVTLIADWLETILRNNASVVEAMDFYGHDMGMAHLAQILIPFLLRRHLRQLKNDCGLSSGAYPPRKDGGYGWFIVEETEDAREQRAPHSAGCNVAEDEAVGYIYYYQTEREYNDALYQNGGTRWMMAQHLLRQCTNGHIPSSSLSDEDAARLIERGLLMKDTDDYRFAFPCFTETQFARFVELFAWNNADLDERLTAWIRQVCQAFTTFVPRRLDSQINQWVSCYLYQIIGLVKEELIARGVIEAASGCDGVFFVEGKWIQP